jgi:olefin beta-lactone synthetase
MNNIAEALLQRASEAPQRIAMHVPLRVQFHGDTPAVAYRDISFAELELRTRDLALGLQVFGIQAGTRTAVMLKPNADFFITMFALFRVGAVPVLIDPGINKAALKECLQRAAPEAFIGIPLAHAARVVLGWARASVRLVITAGARWFWGGESLAAIEQEGARRRALGSTPELFQDRDALAAILFTSGSTGVPKGVEYRHRHFLAQVELLRDAFAIKPGTVNMPTFPPFALFDPALGCTSVLPVMDPRKPAKADPRLLISGIKQFHVHSIFGSPALLRTLVNYCEANKLKLDGVQTIMSAGAPVPPELFARSYACFSEQAKIFAPYGATEALPVALIEGRELLGERRAQSESGAGICVGKPLQKVRILPISAQQILDLASELPAGHVGEIVVQGPSVTDAYYQHADKTALAKIPDDAGVAHRMGDVGYFANDGMLWYCGRMSQRVVLEHATLYTEQIENYFNAHAMIARCALVGVQHVTGMRAVLVVQALGDRAVNDKQLRSLADQHETARHIHDFAIYPSELPTDTRHNAKLQREFLAAWVGSRFS